MVAIALAYACIARSAAHAQDGAPPEELWSEEPGVELPEDVERAVTQERDISRGEIRDEVLEHVEESPPERVSLPGGEEKSAVTSSRLSLPQAEGSLEGMGESFEALLQSGAATYSVPIALPPGRNGVQPSLGLSYTSTRGNGVVGIGWSLGGAFISRQTDRGLPRYVDGSAWHAEEDRFVFAGGQELVPVDSERAMLVDCGVSGCAPIPAELAGWQQYRARVEGAFMRFFRAPDGSRWVVHAPDGSRHDFGLLPASEGPSEVAGESLNALESELPGGGGRVFRWHQTRFSDVHGSVVWYRYHQHGGRAYLRDIHYVSPHASCGTAAAPEDRMRCTAPLTDYGRRVRIVYETREDATTSYVSTWRIETAWRVRRIEVTAAMGAPGSRSLVRRYHLTYDPTSFHSMMTSVQVEGRPSSHDAALGVEVGDTTVAEGSLGDAIVGALLPPIRFGYSSQPGAGAPGFGGVSGSVHAATTSPPHSVDEGRSDLFDVNADGLPDLVVTDPARYRTMEGAPAAAVFFNGFQGPDATPAGAAGTFSEAVPMALPAGLSGVMTLSNANVTPMDADGDGRSELLHMPRTREYGYFVAARNGEHDALSPVEQGWRWLYVQPDLPPDFTDPRIDLGRDASRIRVLDVNNDHLVDVVRTSGTRVQTWLNLGWLPGGDGRFGSYTHAGDGSYSLSTAPLETCLVHAGTPLDFEDPEVRIADMNGDGIQDIVKVRRGRVLYWPGRGEGAWGNGPASCESGFAGDRHVLMDTPPATIGIELDGVHLADVNGDGADDVLQVRFSAIDVWFNRAGAGFSPPVTVTGTPSAAAFAPRVRLADVDGTGTLDVLFGQAGNYQWVDLMGGQRPRLLVRVDNALGGATDITYGTSAEDYVADLAELAACGSSCEGFSWSNLGGECDAKLIATGVCAYRAGASPVVSTVVREVRTSDRLHTLGLSPNEMVTRYAYHDAYYEGIEQEFRGFGAADVEALGDAFHPTSFDRTHFLLGRRPTEIASVRAADNPNEALKGSVYLTEQLDEDGSYLSTTHTAYTLRRLLTGLNGVAVSYAFSSQTDAFTYSQAPFVHGGATLPLPSVTREVATTDGSPMPSLSDPPRDVVVRSATWAQVRSTTDEVDNVGHVLQGTAHGRVKGEFDEALPDETIVTHGTPAVLTTSHTGWLFRDTGGWVDGHGDATRLGDATHEFDAVGNAIRSTTDVTQPVTYAFGGDAEARDYGSPSLDDLRTETAYDVWGQPTAVCEGGDVSTTVGCLAYQTVDYDTGYALHVVAEHTAVRRSGAGFDWLTFTATWDSGLGAVLTTTDPNGAVASMAYDGHGRPTASVPPPAVGCEAGAPVTRIRYDVSADPLSRPVSRVLTTTELSCDGVLDDDVIESIVYVDGLGRTRAALATGDDAGVRAWVKSGVAKLTARGTSRRVYQPSYYAGSPDDFAAVLAEPHGTPYDASSLDAFGRVKGAWDACGNLTWTTYHALSVDVCDPLDNDVTSPHYGTCTTVRHDGHGRQIDQIVRTRQPGSSTTEYHRLFSSYRADGSVVQVVRALTSGDAPLPAPGVLESVQRVLVFDSVGRRIAATDPDTDDPDPAKTAANRSWRYLHNRAGALVAVRDPRGCGQNFFYDLGGRLLGEQYVGCGEAQSHELPVDDVPVGAVALDETEVVEPVDVRAYFDGYADTWAPAPGSFEDYPASDVGGTLGRLTAAVDRAQRSVLAYDERGNAIWAAGQLAVIPAAPTIPGSVGASAGSSGAPLVESSDATTVSVLFDESHTYVTTHAYDHAGRVTGIVLPRDPDWSATEDGPRIGGTLGYGRRGLPVSASTQIVTGGGVPSIADGEVGYGSASVVTRTITEAIEYLRDGLPSSTTYGDGTTSLITYDDCRRPAHASTTRTPTEMPAPDDPLGAVTVVADQSFTWDAANNLVAVSDGRNPAEWPDGHRPRTAYATHDSLYRVAGVEYEYTHESSVSPVDAATDWRAAMAATQPNDPMRTEPAPMVAAVPTARAVSLTWEHDWLGNVVDWTDDAHAFYERSIGAIDNGADVSTTLRPTALYLASDLAGPPAARGGWVELDYGEGGNVVSMTVHAQCVDAGATCADPGGADVDARRAAMRANCACSEEQHYQYRWDELNRLAEARRYDRSGSTGDYALQVRQRYRYDAANQRRAKQTWTASHGERIALHVVPGDVERRGLVRGATSYDADPALGTETQYLVAGARLVWKSSSPVTGVDRDHRLTVPIADLLGTTTAVIDLESGELVEHGTYHPNGARETYRTRPEADVAPEPAGFTSKEADEEVGLVYFGERYLIPRLGRWASPDPLAIHALGGGEPLNSYHYVSGNLLQARDRLGLQPRRAPGRGPDPDVKHNASTRDAAMKQFGREVAAEERRYGCGEYASCWQPQIVRDVRSRSEAWAATQGSHLRPPPSPSPSPTGGSHQSAPSPYLAMASNAAGVIYITLSLRMGVSAFWRAVRTARFRHVAFTKPPARRIQSPTPSRVRWSTSDWDEVHAALREPGARRAPAVGSIATGPVDGSGAATWATARLTPSMLGTGSAAGSHIRPPAFRGGAAGDARLHLIGKWAGGEGSSLRRGADENLVAGLQSRNQLMYNVFERGVQDQVRQGNAVDVWVMAARGALSPRAAGLMMGASTPGGGVPPGVPPFLYIRTDF